MARYVKGRTRKAFWCQAWADSRPPRPRASKLPTTGDSGSEVLAGVPIRFAGRCPHDGTGWLAVPAALPSTGASVAVEFGHWRWVSEGSEHGLAEASAVQGLGSMA
jgi:hypothetical protein